MSARDQQQRVRGVLRNHNFAILMRQAKECSLIRCQLRMFPFFLLSTAIAMHADVQHQ